MRKRAITGFFFIIVMLGSVLLDEYIFGVFYLLLSAFCLWEFYGLLKKAGISPSLVTGILNGVIIFSLVALLPHQEDNEVHKLLFLLPISLSTIFIQELFKKTAAPFTNIAFSFLGIILTVIPFAFFYEMAFLTRRFDFHIPLAFLLMLWANDTGAYLVGSKLGRTKLFERHSPKKTWEGLIGGILIAGVVAYIISIYYVEFSLQQWLWVAVLISCFGTTGDLVESMFKRSIDVKDSGGILPGHGGLLDRFDGLLLAAPIVYSYLYFITNA